MTMASPIFSSFLFFFFFLYSVSSFAEVRGFEGRDKTPKSHQLYYTHLQLASLLPSSTCTHSHPGSKKESSLKVVHRHGPCNQHKQDAPNVPTDDEVLLQDQSRVDFIHSQLSEVSGAGNLRFSEASTLPAKSGSVVGSGNYIVTVGLGTPKKELSLIFDTGSDLTWTQCEPCVKFCYKQQEPIFKPSQSSSYANISCSSSSCSQLQSGTGNTPSCSASTCVYGIQYGDQSYSIGFFAQEKLSLTSTDVFDDFLFGCGQNNQGLFGGAAGLLGLGRDRISVVQQTAQKYGQVFSYCLPSTSSLTGHLTFGSESGTDVKYTPLSSASLGSSYYALDMTAISVGGRRLPIPRSVFRMAGSIIDSGTVITRLPPAAYSALKLEFQRGMTAYPKAQALSILDTCYDLTGYSTIKVPKISFFFNGVVTVELDFSGIFFAASQSQVCLAFAGNKDASSVAIFGNVQQKTLEVVYDIAGQRVGFGPGGCK